MDTAGGGGGVESSSDSSAEAAGSLLPLLMVESTTGPAVGGTRAAVTLQRLRLEVEPTFLLDVGRVFVPSLAGGGGEAPEEVLPKDLRLEPGKILKLAGDEKLSRARRVLADGVAGAEYEIDGGGFALSAGAVLFTTTTITRLNSSVLPFSTNEQLVFPSFKPQLVCFEFEARSPPVSDRYSPQLKFVRRANTCCVNR